MVKEADRRQFWQSAAPHYGKELILESPANQKIAQALSIIHSKQDGLWEWFEEDGNLDRTGAS